MDKKRQKELAASGYVLPDNFGADAKSAQGPTEHKAAQPDDGDDMESKTVEELQVLAEERGVEVKRAKGEGAPLKADYIKALS
jgi:hypothetical protein